MEEHLLPTDLLMRSISSVPERQCHRQIGAFRRMSSLVFCRRSIRSSNEAALSRLVMAPVIRARVCVYDIFMCVCGYECEPELFLFHFPAFEWFSLTVSSVCTDGVCRATILLSLRTYQKAPRFGASLQTAIQQFLMYALIYSF